MNRKQSNAIVGKSCERKRKPITITHYNINTSTLPFCQPTINEHVHRTLMWGAGGVRMG